MGGGGPPLMGRAPAQKVCNNEYAVVSFYECISGRHISVGKYDLKPDN